MAESQWGGNLMNFVAVDIETANSAPDSICELGFVRFENGVEVASWSQVIRPVHSYELAPVNFSKHGITQEEILSAPLLQEVWSQVVEIISGLPLVSHGATQDIKKLIKTAASSLEAGWEFPSNEYHCSLVISRKSGLVSPSDFSLRSLALELGISDPDIVRSGLRVHSAESDARACGLIAMSLIQKAGFAQIQELAKSLDLNLGQISGNEITRKAVSKSQSSLWKSASLNSSEYAELVEEMRLAGWAIENHPQSGKSFLQTLSLESLTDSEFERACALIGADVKTSVSKKLDYLVEGDDPSGKYQKGQTSKSKKARELIQSENAPISILQESEFLALMGPEVIEVVKELTGNLQEAKEASRFGISSDDLKKRKQAADKRESKRIQAENRLKEFLKDPEWTLWKLSPGHKVGFTQIVDQEFEERLTAKCRELGIEVSKSITRDLDLLVIEDSGVSGSAKLRDAVEREIDVTLLSLFLESNPEVSVSMPKRKSLWRNLWG
jgi:DNA polymerase-3 subunit epsilon